MSRLPLIGVSACLKQIGSKPYHVAGDKYLRALISGASGIPLIIPSLGDAIDQEDMLAAFDGLLFTGSASNVEPHHYSGSASVAGTPMIPSATARRCR